MDDDALERHLQTLVSGNYSARRAAEAALVGAPPDDVLRVGLTMLARVKKGWELRDPLAAAAARVQDVAAAVDLGLAALGMEVKRADYWEMELPVMLAPLAGQPALEAWARDALLAPEKKPQVLKRSCAARLLGAAGTASAAAALAARARQDRDRPGGFEAGCDRVYAANFDTTGKPKPLKAAPWREQVIGAMEAAGRPEVWATLLLEAAGPRPANTLDLWKGIARIGGADALPRIARTFAEQPRFVVGPLEGVGEPARPWLRSLTACEDLTVRVQAALALVEQEGDAALPLLRGAAELARPSGRDEEFWWNRAIRGLHERGLPAEGRTGGGPCPFTLKPNARAREGLVLTDEERADLEAREAAFLGEHGL